MKANPRQSPTPSMPAALRNMEADSLAQRFTQAVQHHQAGRIAEAEALYRRILGDHPEHPAVLNNLANTLLRQGKRTAALVESDRAVALMPANPDALTNKANILLELGRLDEAAALHAQVLALKPNHPDPLVNRGTALLELGCYDAALDHFQQALALHPNHAEARLNIAVVQLLHGDFVQGLPNYEARLRMQSSRSFTQPQWRGEPLHGRTILLHAEQGLGDSIQFLRYLPQLVSAGARIVLELPRSLHRLVPSFSGSVQLLSPGDPLPALDVYCPLPSLPLACATTLATIPCTVPYVTVPEEERTQAAALSWPASRLRVGLVWAGNPAHPRDWARSVPLADFAAILQLEEVHFFSLQLGPASAQLAHFPQITDLTPDPANLADTAAKILHLDIVLTVDSAVAHLAGALGMPVWLLLPIVPDWRWLLGRSDSPWYPTMRLFRQPSPGDWTAVFNSVHDVLVQWITAQAVHPIRTQPCMIPPLQAAASPVTVPCKICTAPSHLFGVVDFHKSCVEAQGKRLALAGVPVYYRRCPACRFLFTDSFDQWTDEAFSHFVYNRDYPLVDPDFSETRPASNARMVAEAFASARSQLAILDYGGGNGGLAEILRAQGFNATTYDPFSAHNQMPTTRFDLITCFEVLEHSPRPAATVQAINAFLKPDGLLLFSTLLQPSEIDSLGLNWWYAAPRNGHVSLYSAESLLRLFRTVGLNVASCNQNLHLAYRQPPAFATHLFRGA